MKNKHKKTNVLRVHSPNKVVLFPSFGDPITSVELVELDRVKPSVLKYHR